MAGQREKHTVSEEISAELHPMVAPVNQQFQSSENPTDRVADKPGTAILALFENQVLYNAIADNISNRVEQKMRARRHLTAQYITIGFGALLVIGGGLLTFHFDTLVRLNVQDHLQESLPGQFEKVNQDVDKKLNDLETPGKIFDHEKRLAVLEEEIMQDKAVGEFIELVSRFDQLSYLPQDGVANLNKALEDLTVQNN